MEVVETDPPRAGTVGVHCRSKRMPSTKIMLGSSVWQAQKKLCVPAERVPGWALSMAMPPRQALEAGSDNVRPW